MPPLKMTYEQWQNAKTLCTVPTIQEMMPPLRTGLQKLVEELRHIEQNMWRDILISDIEGGLYNNNYVRLYTELRLLKQTSLADNVKRGDYD